MGQNVKNLKGLRRIADIAGVSHTTVARALKGEAGISNATKQRILEVADNLDFNVIGARKLRKTIGICVHNVASRFCASIARGAEDVLYNRGYSALIQSIRVQGRQTSEVMKMIRNRGVEGAIVQMIPSEADIGWVSDAMESNYDLVLVDCKMPFINTNYVVSDNFKGAFDLVKTLYAHGCRNIAFVGCPVSQASCFSERFQGYQVGLEHVGLSNDKNLTCICPEAANLVNNPQITSWVRGDIEVDGIIAVNNALIGSIAINYRDMNPEFFSKCIFGEFDCPLPEIYLPNQFYADQNPYNMGYRAAEILVDQMEGKSNRKIVQEVTSVPIVDDDEKIQMHRNLISQAVLNQY